MEALAQSVTGLPPNSCDRQKLLEFIGRAERQRQQGKLKAWRAGSEQRASSERASIVPRHSPPRALFVEEVIEQKHYTTSSRFPGTVARYVFARLGPRAYRSEVTFGVVYASS